MDYTRGWMMRMKEQLLSYKRRGKKTGCCALKYLDLLEERLSVSSTPHHAPVNHSLHATWMSWYLFFSSHFQKTPSCYGDAMGIFARADIHWHTHTHTYIYTTDSYISIQLEMCIGQWKGTLSQMNSTLFVCCSTAWVVKSIQHQWNQGKGFCSPNVQTNGFSFSTPPILGDGLFSYPDRSSFTIGRGSVLVVHY